MLTTHQSDTAALKYLRARNALAKLATDVPVIFRCPHAAQALRRAARSRALRIERRSRRMTAWSIHMPLIWGLSKH